MITDHNLARRLERTEASAGAAFVEARRGESFWQEIGGAYAMFDGRNSPITQTFGLGMFEPANTEVLQQIEEFFHTRHAPVQHEVCPLAGVALLQTMVERHYVPCEISNVLCMDLSGFKYQSVAPSELSVRLAGVADAAVYTQAAAEGWKEHGQVSDMIAGMTRVMVAAKGYSGFLVEKAGRVIASAGLIIHEKVALLAGASTIPEARGQGAQRAVLCARLQYAVDSGCDLAMFVAEPGGASQRNAERSGFRIAYTRTKWRLDSP